MSSNDSSKLQVSQLGKNPGKKTGVNLHEFPCWPSWSELGGKDGQAFLMGHQHIKSNAANLMTSKLWSL